MKTSLRMTLLLGLLASPGNSLLWESAEEQLRVFPMPLRGASLDVHEAAVSAYAEAASAAHAAVGLRGSGNAAAAAAAAVAAEASTLPAEAEAHCERRLAHLLALVGAGAVDEAVELSFALHQHGPTRVAPESACARDRPHAGEGSFVSQVATSARRGSARDPAATITSVVLHSPAVDTAAAAVPPPRPLKLHLPAHAPGQGPRRRLLPLVRHPIVGMALDGVFYLSSSPLRCRYEAANDDPAAATGIGAALALAAAGIAAPTRVTCDGGHLAGTMLESAEAAIALAERLMRHRGQGRHSGQGHRSLNVRMARPALPDDALVKAAAAAAAETRADGLADADTTFVVGTKKILALPVCPAGSPNCFTSAPPHGFCDGLVKSTHGCTESGVFAYFAQLQATAGAFLEASSWGALSLTWTTTPMLSLDYDADTCGDATYLDYWSGKDPAAIDVMAFTAAVQASSIYRWSNYAYNVIFMPYCQAAGFTGIGWVGVQGALLGLTLTDYDASLTHELGHNFGADHASYMYGGSRGANAWVDAASTWSEYGSPHSTMGQGDITEYVTDFMVEGKLVFDWLADTEVEFVSPFSDAGGGLCSPQCGPFLLAPTDTGAKANGATLGLAIATATSGRYFFVEHRTSSTKGHAALVNWADVSSGGYTGYYGNSVLVDCTPGTSDWEDAGCAPGSSIVLDAGDASSSSRPFMLTVAKDMVNGTLLSVTVQSTDTSAPTATPAPSTYCVDFELTMNDSYGDGWNGNRLYMGEFEFSLSDGSSATETICLPPGDYSPYSCGGTWTSEVSWSVSGTGVSGGADSACTQSSGSFSVGAKPTQTPSLVPSPIPTVLPAPAPTRVPSFTLTPTRLPVFHPTVTPTPKLTSQPSRLPSHAPKPAPSSKPSVLPTLQPSIEPVPMPTLRPTSGPTRAPVHVPTTGPRRQGLTAAPLFTPVGYTTVAGTEEHTSRRFKVGELIYGPFEAEFDDLSSSEAVAFLVSLGCSTAKAKLASLNGGIDTKTLEEVISAKCGITLPRLRKGVYYGVMDKCGGHNLTSNEYRFHKSFSCLYNEEGSHSIRVGETIDRNQSLYGRWENFETLTLPALDACGGHYGKTPEALTRETYHYHVQTDPPFTFGCYGPNEDGSSVSRDQCKALYPEYCDQPAFVTSVTTVSGGIYDYNKWCPCFDNEYPTAHPTQPPTRSLATESSSSCESLGWTNAARYGSSNVCGESNDTPLSGCSGTLSWHEAKDFCELPGARLCTKSEVLDDEATRTGCSLDGAQVWTSTECEDGFWVANAKKASASECLASTEARDVRCCADVDSATSPAPTPFWGNAATVSASSCDDLGWSNAEKYGSASVCGESDKALGGCSAALSWVDARDFCESAGARMCTEDEVFDDEATSTGCGIDNTLVWTSTACGGGYHMLTVGSMSPASECASNTEANKVRCCADVEIQAPAPTPATNAALTTSTSSCDDLGWTNAARFGSLAVCGNSDDPALGGCSSASSWTKAKDFCQDAGARMCTSEEIQNDEATKTGCGLDSTLVWSATECDSGHMVAVGSDNPAEVCTANSEATKVRCCADVASSSSAADGADAPAPTPQTAAAVSISASSCDDLGWTNSERYGSSRVCSESDGPALGSCSSALTWTDAKDFCESAGARMCTSNEIQSDEAAKTGCGLDSTLVWSATECDSGHMVAVGSENPAEVCTENSEATKVRCCADA